MRKPAWAIVWLLIATAAVRADSYTELNAGIQVYNIDLWDDVIIHMDRALVAGDLVPSLQFVAHLDRGLAHLELKHYDLAIADFSAGLAIQPGDAVALSRRSVAHLVTNKTDEALADLDSLIAARPMLRSAYQLRAALNLQRDKLDRVKDDLRSLLSLRGPDEPKDRGVGIIDWELGRTSEADDNFSAVAERGKGDVYSWMWLVLTRAKLGKDVPRRAVPEYDKAAWPAPIAGHFLGETSQDAVFAAAQQGDADAVKGQVCEANFYIGEWLLQRHDSAAAKPMLAKAAADCPQGFVEWSPAKMELAALP